MGRLSASPQQGPQPRFPVYYLYLGFMVSMLQWSWPHTHAHDRVWHGFPTHTAVTSLPGVWHLLPCSLLAPSFPRQSQDLLSSLLCYPLLPLPDYCSGHMGRVWLITEQTNVSLSCKCWAVSSLIVCIERTSEWPVTTQTVSHTK